MPSRSIDDLQPSVRLRARDFLQRCEYRGFLLVVTSTLRTFAEQDALYAQGRTAPGKIVTKAQGGFSWHNFGRAFDVVFKTPNGITYAGPWDAIGELGELCGLEWGGRWKRPDRPHFQMTEGLTLEQARSRKELTR